MADFGKKRSGVAMIVTLTILLMLSVALMKTFESRSVEVAHLSNDIHRFQAESLARSLFRATLSSIQQEGLFSVQNVLSLMTKGENSFPFENGFCSDFTLTPIDYRFNLNKLFSPQTPDHAIIFFNIIQDILAQSADENRAAFNLSDYDIFPVLSAINDWRDTDDFPDEEYQEGIEQYPLDELAFEVKNSSFDVLSELKLIPRFKDLNLTDHELHSFFRVKGAEEFIDINLASQNEIVNFLSLYREVEGYETVYDYRNEIAEVAKQDIPLSGEPKYPLTVDTKNSSSQWRQDLESINIITLTSNEQDLFKAKTNHLEISYVVTVGNINLRLNSIVKLNYSSDEEDKIERFDILSFGYR